MAYNFQSSYKYTTKIRHMFESNIRAHSCNFVRFRWIDRKQIPPLPHPLAGLKVNLKTLIYKKMTGSSLRAA